MRLPVWVFVLGFAGLAPFIAGPLWLTLAPDSAPAALDRIWLLYGALIASFMAGSFWGFALPAAEGPEGVVGVVLASILMIATWAAAILPFSLALPGLGSVFLLLLLADYWRERTLGEVEGYFRLRTILTAGVIAAIAWRLLLQL